MTPLHFACDTTCQLFEDDQAAPRGPPNLTTVRILLAGSLDAVIMEDVDEMNPIEYAILSDAGGGDQTLAKGVAESSEEEEREDASCYHTVVDKTKEDASCYPSFDEANERSVVEDMHTMN
ncbi:hypothetical protein ACHAWF_005250, partial [Thalassiosira exigua]